MTRREFMQRLDSCLICIDRAEREAALRYYEEYFDDAGPEREAEVIASLGSPEALAREIIAEAGSGSTAEASGAQPAGEPSEFHSIKAELVNANFTLVTGNAWRVDIDYPDNVPLPRVAMKNGVLSIEEEHIRFGFFKRGGWKPGRINVTVPDASFRSFDIECVNGTLSIADVSVESMHCHTVNGVVEVNGVRVKKLHSEGVNGDIRLISLHTAQSCHAETVNGTITLGGELRGDIHAETVNGAIGITTSMPIQEYGVRVETVSGAVRINGDKYGKSVCIKRDTGNCIRVNGVNGGVTLGFGV